MKELTQRTNKGGKFFWIHNRLFDVKADSKPYIIAVYAALCLRANKEQKCWPSQTRIAQDTGMSVRKVKSVIQDLEKLGLVQVIRSKARGKSRNNYLLTGVEDWRLQSAPRAPYRARPAPGKGHLLPPNNIKKNNTHINNTPYRNKARIRAPDADHAKSIIDSAGAY